MPEDHKTPPQMTGTTGAKKPYTKPSVVSEPIYETLALACGKRPGGGGSCKHVPRRS